ncbi:MAG: Ig-like domain repeat protein [Gemmatimonadaceae bacterium]
MAIDSAVYFRRLAHTGLSVLLAMSSLCGIATAQTPVTSGSPIPVTHATWGQIMKVQVAKNGSVVFLDWSTSGLYQLSPGKTTFTTIASGSPLEASGTYWNSGLTMDAKDTIYIADRYGNAHFFRIPYNPADGTWDFTSGNAWGATIGGGLNTFDVAFINSAAADGSGTLVVSTETSPSIFTVPVDNQGNWGTAVTVVKGLKAKAAHITADVNGNIYFLEDNGVSASSRVTGIFFIPAGKTGITGAGDGTAEAQISRIDPSSNTAQFSGITLDPAGNIYLDSQSDSNGGAFNGELMIPNVSGSPVGVGVTSFDFNKATFLAPVQSSATMAVDPRGYLWIPTSTSGWNPPGSTTYPGTNNVVLWAMGSANLAASPVGKAGAAGTVFFNFSTAVTPGKFVFSQPGGGSDFVAASNPIADPNATTPQLPCTPGTLYPGQTSCPFWVSLNPRLPGAVSGELAMLDATNAVIPQSTTYLSGIGQGPDISLLIPGAQTALATGLVAPQQVAADALGNAYVADSSQGKVLMFAASATPPTAGVSIGTGLSAPTGVAVDGAGDVYIADSGKVIEIPFVNGALNTTGQTTLQSGLGTNLRLAADGSGNVFVTDPDHSRVVKISNPLTSTVASGLVTVGSGFTKPSAIKTDSAGDIFVADGTTLSEITAPFYGPPVAITNSLASPVTGLAVDPSGSVDVAQAGGILHIPSTGGTLSANSAVAIGGAVTKPNGLAIDSRGNLYVSDLTGTTPNLRLLSLNGAVDFGQVSPFVPSNPVDVTVFNIGNASLSISPDPTFSGTNASEFATTAATQNGCDTTGATPVTAGSSCIIDVTLTATDVGTRSGTMTVTSNAANASSVTASLTGTGVNNLERSKVVLALNPSTGVSYPGSTVATVTVSPTVSTTTPTGQVILTLINQNAKLHQTTVYPAGTLSAAGVATFNLTGILGGTYTVQAVYHGDSQFSGGLVTTTLTVAQAAPTVTLSQPTNITPVLGVYYVPLGSNTTLQAAVTSSKGTPTGSVIFMNGSKVADSTQASTTLDANGKATFTTGNLPTGTYTLTAVYSSDQNFSAATSPVITFQVIPPSLIITANPPSLTVTAGIPAQTVLTLTSLVGYEATNTEYGGVNIFCDNTTVPKYSECTFDVPQVQILAGKTATTTLTLSSNLPVNIGAVRSGPSEVVFAGILGLGLLGLAFRRKATRHRAGLTIACMMLVLAGTVMSVSGCTNSGYTTTPPSPHVVTPSGSYNVRIYATDPHDGTVKTLAFTLPVTVK